MTSKQRSGPEQTHKEGQLMQSEQKRYSWLGTWSNESLNHRKLQSTQGAEGGSTKVKMVGGKNCEECSWETQILYKYFFPSKTNLLWSFVNLVFLVQRQIPPSSCPYTNTAEWGTCASWPGCCYVAQDFHTNSSSSPHVQSPDLPQSHALTSRDPEAWPVRGLWGKYLDHRITKQKSP